MPSRCWNLKSLISSLFGHAINPWNIDQACSMKMAGYSWYWPRSFLRFYCVFIGQYLAILTTRLDNNAFFLPEQWVISRQKNMLRSAMPQLLRTIMGSNDNKGPEEAQGYMNQRALTYFAVRCSGFTFSFSTFCCGRFALEWLFQLALFWLKGNAKRIKSSEGILLWNSPRVVTECRGRENISTSPPYMIY